MSKKLILPDDLCVLLAQRFDKQHRNWLIGDGQWPMMVPLGMPLERDVVEDATAVRKWIEAWSVWSGPGELQWEERQWVRLGRQRLPAALCLSSALEVASAVRQEERWVRAEKRYLDLIHCWPALSNGPQLARNFAMLADYSDEDFDRLLALFTWLDANPESGLYPRQLPVAGLDTKWMEKRRVLIVDLMQSLRSQHSERDFHVLCGLRKPSYRMRIRVLCPALRSDVGGLTDMEAPVEELAKLTFAPRLAIIVENLETGLALPDVEGAVAFMKLGNAVGALIELPWLRDLPGIYWGDIDTHGFAILSRARAVMPQLISVLMDEKTLLAHKPLWCHELVQNSETMPANLTFEERAVYDGLLQQRWGRNLRMEQERVAWADVLEMLRALGRVRNS